MSEGGDGGDLSGGTRRGAWDSMWGLEGYARALAFALSDSKEPFRL